MVWMTKKLSQDAGGWPCNMNEFYWILISREASSPQMGLVSSMSIGWLVELNSRGFPYLKPSRLESQIKVPIPDHSSTCFTGCRSLLMLAPYFLLFSEVFLLIYASCFSNYHLPSKRYKSKKSILHFQQNWIKLALIWFYYQAENCLRKTAIFVDPAGVMGFLARCARTPLATQWLQ